MATKRKISNPPVHTDAAGKPTAVALIGYWPSDEVRFFAHHQTLTHLVTHFGAAGQAIPKA